MQYSTPTNNMSGPSEATLFMIRRIAYAFNDHRTRGYDRKLLLN